MTLHADARAFRHALSIPQTKERTRRILDALSWNRPDAQVEWKVIPAEVGRFTISNFPTSAALVTAQTSPLKLAWESGFRWCLTTEEGAVDWYDLKLGRHWRGQGDSITQSALEGLTSESFADTGEMAPKAVNFDDFGTKYSIDPSHKVAEKIRQWWTSLYQQYLVRTEKKSGALTDHNFRRNFTSAVAAVLLLRTVEDMNGAPWLKNGTLRVAAKSQRTLGLCFRMAAERLNSRVLKANYETLPHSTMRNVIDGSYDLGVDLAALDVDPVGAFYEEMLGYDYPYTPMSQRSLFGDNDFDIRQDSAARRREGVYYTPRIYADTLAQQIVRPRVRASESENELPVIADISAGSGELLCAALREILSEPMWRTPQTAWTMLDEKIYAIDINPLALDLCALNLLRTAIRYVPAILDTRRPALPALNKNLVDGDALTLPTLEKIPSLDIVLINPPFQSSRRWQIPPNAIPQLNEVRVKPNRAVAFLAAAIAKCAPNAGIGAVLPSHFFSAETSAEWRSWVAEKMSVDLVVSHFGQQFRDAHSYAGLLLGHRRETTQWRPRSRIVRVGPRTDDLHDTGALMSEMARPSLARPVKPGLESWLLDPEPVSIYVKRGTQPLREVIGDCFHQGVSPAPKFWGQNLFLFRDLGDGSVTHCYDQKSYDNISTTQLWPVARAKSLNGNVPLWCEPVSPSLFAYLPHPDETMSALKDRDVSAWRLARAIRKAVLAKSKFVRSEPDLAFVKSIKKGLISFHTTKGYDPRDERALLYASKSSVTEQSQGLNRAWHSWLSISGEVIPLSGTYARVDRVEIGAVLSVWMTIDEIVAPLYRQSIPRIGGSQQFRLMDINSWEIPDLRHDSFQKELDSFYLLYLEYREEANGLPFHDVFDLRLYKKLQDFAKKLWRGT